MAPHSSTLAWEIPWMDEPGGLQSMGSRRVGHDWATSPLMRIYCMGQGTLLSVLWWLEWEGNPKQRGYTYTYSWLSLPYVGACSLTSGVSDSLQPSGLWLTRLLCPWDSPGKNTGVGCHFLLQLWRTADTNTTLYSILYSSKHQFKKKRGQDRSHKNALQNPETSSFAILVLTYHSSPNPLHNRLHVSSTSFWCES